MTHFRVLASVTLLLCGACATDSRHIPEYVGEALEVCDDRDIPSLEFHLRSASDQISMDMHGYLLHSAIGSHQFHGIDLCQRASPTSCRAVDGQFELQELSWRNATGRLRLSSDPPGTWHSFVLKASRLEDTVCG
jgi:hypothetical protein